MKKINFLILIFGTIALFSCTDNDEELNSKEVVNLQFRRKSSAVSKNSETLINVDVNVLSYTPLEIESDEVMHIKIMMDESGIKSDGLVLVEDYMNVSNNQSKRLIETSGYIFNSRTQCFMYGTYITDTDTGKWTFLFALPAVQAQMNKCAPSGQMYARYK